MPALSSLALAGAGLGAAKGISNNAANKKDEKYRKAAIQYSPWTGMSDPGQQQRSGILGSMLQGGLMGAAGGQALGLGGAAGAAGAATAAPTLGVAEGFSASMAPSLANVQRMASSVGGAASVPSLGGMASGLTTPAFGASQLAKPMTYNLGLQAATSPENQSWWGKLKNALNSQQSTSNPSDLVSMANMWGRM